LTTAAIAGIATGASLAVLATVAAVYIYQPFEILAAKSATRYNSLLQY